ncbi:MAG: hypothetical protein IRY99_11375 [Isosphaeraceae bacterium]|nr:hypothetical protein [Isosphaeraceae bacterium]
MNERVMLPGVLLALVAVMALEGCGGGDELPRQEVSGTVTLNGQPLEDGSIQFQPAGTGQGAAVSGGSMITNGRYRIRRDQGLVPGTYKVMIFSHGETSGDASEPGAQTGPPPELIPAQYNAATTLTAEVTTDKPNVFNFDLKK